MLGKDDACMVKQQAWQKALHQLANFFSTTGAGAFLFDAAKDYHRKKVNPKLIFVLKCAGCTANIYLRVEDVALRYFGGGHTAPQIACGCGHARDHEFVELGQEDQED